MTDKHDTILPPQAWILAASTLYVLALIASHASLPEQHVWIIAAVFSIIMNGVYIQTAFKNRRFVTTEAGIALALIILSVLGPTVSPTFVILAIAGHGIWDVAKHYGAGIPFFSWYTWGCAAVDFAYAVALTLYLFR